MGTIPVPACACERPALSCAGLDGINLAGILNGIFNATEVPSPGPISGNPGASGTLVDSGRDLTEGLGQSGLRGVFPGICGFL